MLQDELESKIIKDLDILNAVNKEIEEYVLLEHELGEQQEALQEQVGKNFQDLLKCRKPEDTIRNMAFNEQMKNKLVEYGMI